MTTRDLCYSCAVGVYGNTAPNDRYAKATANLLWGTCMAESLGRYRRQVGFAWDKHGGAWGLWQTERLAVQDNLLFLARNEALCKRAGTWLFQHPKADADSLYVIAEQGYLQFCQLIAGWDRLACLMARIHYFRVPAPIPYTIEEQAQYWKKYYNTVLGKGTPEGYLQKNVRSAWFE